MASMDLFPGQWLPQVVLMAALEVGLIEALLDAPLIPEEVAEKLALDERATLRVISVLVDAGYLEQQGDGVVVAPDARALLDPTDAAFVGDTLFMPDYGTARTDFPGGDAATLYRSIRKILDLPPQTRVFVGHDYLPEGRTEFRWETTVADQRAHNIHIHDGVDEAAFVTQREARNKALAPPALILPSLQVNIRAGALPAPSDKGRVFLKLPVTMA